MHKNKSKNGIKQTWSKNGNLFFKNEHDNVHQVTFDEYQYWLAMEPQVNRTEDAY